MRRLFFALFIFINIGNAEQLIIQQRFHSCSTNSDYDYKWTQISHSYGSKIFWFLEQYTPKKPLK